MSTMLPPDRIPVIAGIGEVTDRPKDWTQGLEPLALMAQAIRRAEADAGAALVAKIDSIDLVNQVTWPYAGPAALLCERLGISPARAVYGPVGGESPIRYLNEAAARIARGESRVAVVCGAEAQSTLGKARKAGAEPAWTPKAEKPEPSVRASEIVHRLAIRHGVIQPITVYPFYDAGSAHHWGQRPDEALAESGLLWSRYARVAATNPYSWLGHAFTPEQITTPTADNRLIAWPYTKLMVANPTVNQGSALILTSLAVARAAGIAEDRLIHVWGGAAANEPRDYLKRDHYHGSHAQDVVLETAVSIAGEAGFDALELYSCFPCVPKMARRTLGLGPDVMPTVTGGLTFFGAPLNDYMTHAACAMVRRMRDGADVGLLYGQGEFVTKHHALVLGRRPAADDRITGSHSVQETADGRRGPVPEVVETASGRATVESHTVIYDREGAATHGVVILRTADGGRTLARVPVSDAASLALLTAPDRYAIGLAGDVVQAADGLLEWHAA